VLVEEGLTAIWVTRELDPRGGSAGVCSPQGQARFTRRGTTRPLTRPGAGAPWRSRANGSARPHERRAAIWRQTRDHQRHRAKSAQKYPHESAKTRRNYRASGDAWLSPSSGWPGALFGVYENSRPAFSCASRPDRRSSRPRPSGLAAAPERVLEGTAQVRRMLHPVLPYGLIFLLAASDSDRLRED
jgi:hypothetical protein